jgi:hypothetical protein
MSSSIRAATLIAVIALTAAPLHLEAQSVPPPDSVVVPMISPALFRLLEYEIAGAALGRRHIMKIELPDGRLWSRVAAHILVATNGRPPTPSDSSVTAIGIRQIRFVSDTLIATVYREIRWRCPGQWVGSGTDFDARTQRVGDHWTQITVKPGATWDTFTCAP